MSIYEGYLSFGGNEIVNNTRTRRIAESAQPCPMHWLKGDVCDVIPFATFDPAGYTWADIGAAPWYDLDVPASINFFGFFATAITEALDSTRTVSRTEGITDGGILGRTRKATKTMRVKGLLIGRGREAIEYGQTWLSSAVDPGTCGQHGSDCGLTDLEWFVDCPPVRGTVTEPNPNPELPPIIRPQTDAEYAASVNRGVRYLHDVACLSGPLIVNTLNSGDFWAYEVEMVFGAERPWVYGVTRDINLNPTVPIVIQDIPYNLAPYPSAELAAGVVQVARNLSANPSVETNATGWVAAAVANTGTALPGTYFTSGRSTELAAVGTASMRGRILGSGSAAGTATVTLSQVTTLASVAERVSLSIWAAGIVITTGTIGAVNVYADWLTSGDVAIGAPVLLGTAANPSEVSGKVYALKSQKPPATAAKVRIRAVFSGIAWTATSDHRLYADALAVTVP